MGSQSWGGEIAVSTTDKVFSYSLILKLQYVLNVFVGNFVSIGFSLLPSLCLLSELRATDVIFATADTYGLPIALLKKYNVIKKPLILNTVGLYDGLLYKKSILVKKIVSSLIKEVDYIVSGGSFQECKKLAKYLDFPQKKCIFIPFGIDINFFKPQKNVTERNQILVIGADPSRDWKLHIEVASKLPSEHFIFVTYKGVIQLPLSQNITCLYNVSFTDLKQLMLESKYLLLLTKLNHYVSGQSTAFRGMSCGKAVIFTKNPGFEEYPFVHKRHCLMVNRGNVNEVLDAIKFLNKKKERDHIGKSAREIISKKYNVRIYGNKLSQLFLSGRFREQ